jgi:hypothetical protein
MVSTPQTKKRRKKSSQMMARKAARNHRRCETKNDKHSKRITMKLNYVIVCTFFFLLQEGEEGFSFVSREIINPFIVIPFAS